MPYWPADGHVRAGASQSDSVADLQSRLRSTTAWVATQIHFIGQRAVKDAGVVRIDR
jgi:hypothetical protein